MKFEFVGLWVELEDLLPHGVVEVFVRLCDCLVTATQCVVQGSNQVLHVVLAVHFNHAVLRIDWWLL